MVPAGRSAGSEAGHAAELAVPGVARAAGVVVPRLQLLAEGHEEVAGLGGGARGQRVVGGGR